MQPILADKAFPELVQWADELAALRRDIFMLIRNSVSRRLVRLI